MKQYISEGRAIYEDTNHGLFSKSLAEWAIGNMYVKDPSTKEKKRLKSWPLEEVKTVLKDNGVELPEMFDYTAWYLFNMALADYPKTVTDNRQRALFIDETICDPDGCPEAVLECFATKMALADIPIFWEKHL